MTKNTQNACQLFGPDSRLFHDRLYNPTNPVEAEDQIAIQEAIMTLDFHQFEVNIYVFTVQIILSFKICQYIVTPLISMINGGTIKILRKDVSGDIKKKKKKKKKRRKNLTHSPDFEFQQPASPKVR